MQKHRDRFFENVNGHDYRTTHVMTSRSHSAQLAGRPGTAPVRSSYVLRRSVFRAYFFYLK